MERSALIELSQGTIVCKADNEPSNILFPLWNGSPVLVTKSGTALETAEVGKEGLLPAMAGLGIYASQVRAVVRISEDPLEGAGCTIPQTRRHVANLDFWRCITASCRNPNFGGRVGTARAPCLSASGSESTNSQKTVHNPSMKNALDCEPRWRNLAAA